METYHIQEHTVLFDQTNHEYFVDGRKVVSISQIVREMLPRHYKNVDPEILKIAAEKGLQLRDMIEAYERHGQKTYHPEMQGYIALKRQHQFSVLESETIVLLWHHGVVIAAGRFDMVIESPYHKGIGIADVKRMAHLQIDHLTLQLNLYKLAYEQTYKRRIEYLKCIHVRNRYHSFEDIRVDPNYVKETLEKYLEKHPLDYTAFS